MNFAEWSRNAGTQPVIWPARKPRPIGLLIRVMPTIYPWRPIDIETGELCASISINRATIRHPEPFDQDGLTDACHDFLIEAVQAASTRLGYQMAITWPDRTTIPIDP